MTKEIDFAILAPVPEEHLITGLQIASTEDFVAYGTMKWELLQKIDEMRDGTRVAMLIYPSHEDLLGKDSFIVSWFGWYVGYIHSNHGAHPLGKKHRPSSTFNYPTDNSGHWAVFWHIEGLHKLPSSEHITIGKIEGYKGGWRKDAPPRGPELVKLPEIFNNKA